MRKYSLLRRIFLFLAGTFLAGIGVAATARAELGTSPISSVPYVLTFVFPVTFGLATVLFNGIFILLQHALLREKFQKLQYCQMLVALSFGLCIDFGMFLTSFYVPASYHMKFVELLLGCLILAFGVSLQMMAELLYLPGDGFVKVFAEFFRKRFEFTKIGFDFTLALAALLISILTLNSLVGVREGTLVAVLSVGLFIRFFLKRSRGIRKWMIVPVNSK